MQKDSFCNWNESFLCFWYGDINSKSIVVRAVYI